MSTVKRMILGDDRDPREVLAEIFDVPAPQGGSPQPEAVSWARDVLAGAGVDPRQDPVRAIAVLRRADGRLGLVTTKYLVSHL